MIIKLADKGGPRVIMDKSYYRDKMLEMLSDTETYVELDQNKDDLVMKKIKRLTRQYEHELTKQEIDYIQNFSWRTSNFYGLPKTHKSWTINNAIKKQNTTYVKAAPLTDVLFRPIVAGPSSPSHRLSNFIDITSKPLCNKVPSFYSRLLRFLKPHPRRG